MEHQDCEETHGDHGDLGAGDHDNGVKFIRAVRPKEPKEPRERGDGDGEGDGERSKFTVVTTWCPASVVDMAKMWRSTLVFSWTPECRVGERVTTTSLGDTFRVKMISAPSGLMGITLAISHVDAQTKKRVAKTNSHAVSTLRLYFTLDDPRNPVNFDYDRENTDVDTEWPMCDTQMPQFCSMVVTP